MAANIIPWILGVGLISILCIIGTESQSCPEQCETHNCNRTYCYSCRGGTYHNPARTKCPVCVPDCESCFNMTHCRRCNRGFYRNRAYTQCLAYFSNCQNMNETDGTCISCKKWYGLTSDKRCGACAPDCIRCATSGAGKCDVCKEGFTRKEDRSSCAACADNCRMCHIKGPSKCDHCKTGYKLNGDKCVKRTCKSNCLCDADDSNRCDRCDEGYTQNSNVRDGPCLACGSNCLRCDTPGLCDRTCKPRYKISPVTRQCVYSKAVSAVYSLLTVCLSVLGVYCSIIM